MVMQKAAKRIFELHRGWGPVLVLALMSSCIPAEPVTDSGSPMNDAGFDAGGSDAGEVDAGAADAGLSDAGETDAGLTDAGDFDAGTLDAGPDDAGTVDGGEMDAGMAEIDAGEPDAGEIDAGMEEVDAGEPDAGEIDAGIEPVACSGVPMGFPVDDLWARERTTVDQPDDEPGEYQIHVLYVEPSDKTAAVPLDVDGTIRRSVTAFNAWFAARTAGPRLRIDTCRGDIDVTFVKLPPGQTEAAMATGVGSTFGGPAFIRDRLEDLLSTEFSDPHKLYLVYWDGLTYARCGGAPYPPALPGHFTTLNVGGIFQATFLTAQATQGDTVLDVYSTFEMGLPVPPFTATLGTETLQVIASTDTTLTLAQPLAATHSAQQTVRAVTNIPDCRANPFSVDGEQLNYWEMASAHECLHPLGIVSSAAPHFAQPPTAAGHLDIDSAAGRFDLMYQGDQAWGCAATASSPATSVCELDPANVEYWRVPGGSAAVDLAKSVFLTPTRTNPELPVGW